MPRTYGVGIIGAGNISMAYLRLAPLFRGIEVRGIADILPEAAEKRGAEFGVHVMTPDEMLKSPEIEVVLNLTTPSAHYRIAMEAIAAGKHVYSEKPFVLSVAEGRRIKKAAASRGVLVCSAPDTFLGGAHQQVRDLIDRKEIGRITHGTAHAMGRGMEHWHPNPGFFFEPGAGPLLDIGPYYVTALVNLLGPVRRVTAFANSARPKRTVTTPNVAMTGKAIKVGTPTTIHGILEFHSGAIITLATSWDTYSHGHHNIELYGTEGAVFVPDPNYFGGEVVIADRSGDRRKVAPWDHPLGEPNQGLDTANPRANYRSAGLADMVQALTTQHLPRCGVDLALHAVDAMTALLQASDTGRVIALTTTCERPAALKPAAARKLLRREVIPIPAALLVQSNAR